MLKSFGADCRPNGRQVLISIAYSRAWSGGDGLLNVLVRGERNSLC